MKKIIQILSIVFVFTLTMQAQKRAKNKGVDITVDQRATLAVKKMTLALDLSDRQQKQLKPVLANQITDKIATRNKIKASRESGKRPTNDEKFAMANNSLDQRIAFKKNMKQILNKEQFERFEKMAKKRGAKMKMKKIRKIRSVDKK